MLVPIDARESQGVALFALVFFPSLQEKHTPIVQEALKYQYQIKLFTPQEHF